MGELKHVQTLCIRNVDDFCIINFSHCHFNNSSNGANPILLFVGQDICHIVVRGSTNGMVIHC